VDPKGCPPFERRVLLNTRGPFAVNDEISMIASGVLALKVALPIMRGLVVKPDPKLSKSIRVFVGES